MKRKRGEKIIRRTKGYLKNNISGGNVGVLFPPDIKDVYSISEWYAGATTEGLKSGLYCRELQISLTAYDWYKFQEQLFYRDLIQYLDNLKIQKQNKPLGETKDLKEKEGFL